MKISSGISVVPRSIVFVGVPIDQNLWLIPFTNFTNLILTKRSHSWSIVTNTASKVELFIVDNDTCVPDSVDLLANHLHGHLACHALRHVIHVEFDWEHR